MSGLCWIVFIVSFGHSWTAVDQKKLATIIQGIRNEYHIQGQFSLALNIPVDQDLNGLETFFKKDLCATVRDKISKDEIYQGINVVAAKFKKAGAYTDHAEARVLDKIRPLADSSKGHFLVFYSYLSPCGSKCTNKSNRHNILDKVNQIITKWKNYAFVFSKVFDKTRNGTVINRHELVEALKQLSESKIGQKNIFRCYKPKTAGFLCIRCFRDGKLSDECVNNNT